MGFGGGMGFGGMNLSGSGGKIARHVKFPMDLSLEKYGGSVCIS